MFYNPSSKPQAAKLTLRPAYCVCSVLLSSILVLCMQPVSTSYADEPASQAQTKIEEILDEIDQIQSELNVAQIKLEEAQIAQNSAQEAMSDASQRMIALEAQIDVLKERLAVRVWALYRDGSTSILDVLMGSTTFGEFLNRIGYIQKIAERDADLIREGKTLRDEAQEAQREYSRQKSLADSQADLARSVKISLSEKRSQLETQVASLAQQAESLEAQAATSAGSQDARAAEAAAAKAEAAFKAQQEAEAKAAEVKPTPKPEPKPEPSKPKPTPQPEPKPVPSVSTKTIIHPCPGARVSSGFGYRSFDNSFHKGIDYAAPEGTPYYAVASGTVIIATSSVSAGNWIVIAHGGGMVTKYMHSSEIFVKPGQHVSQGDHIGNVGNTGYSTGSHLHFQLEVSARGWRGTPVDPNNFY